MDIFEFDDYYGYDPAFGEAMVAAMAVIGVIALIIGLLSLLLWILRSIGLMTIARNRGLNNPWLTWIPVVGAYTLGAIADDIQEKEGGRTVFRWLLLGGNIASWVLSGSAGAAGIREMFRAFQSFSYGYDYDPDGFGALMATNVFSSIGGLVSLGVFIVAIISLFYLYKCYRPQSATSYTVLSVIFPFLQSIFPFAIRNNQPNWIKQPPYGQGGYAPPAGEPWQQGYYQPPYRQDGYPPQQPGPYGGHNPQQEPWRDDNNDSRPQ